MSTTPAHDETTQTHALLAARVAQLCDSIARVGSKAESKIELLERALPTICETLTSKCGILWLPDGVHLRWHASVGIAIEDASIDSPFTKDVVINAKDGLESGLVDVLTCNDVEVDESESGSEGDDSRIRSLVLRSRQIVIPVETSKKPYACILIFQPNNLNQGDSWSIEELESLQDQLECSIDQIEIISAPQNCEDEELSQSDHSESGQQHDDDKDQSIVQADPPMVQPDGSEASFVENPRIANATSSRELDQERYIQVRKELHDQVRANQVFDVIGRSLHETECCFDIANELRTYFGEGRVSVAVVRGTSCRVRSISNQQVFDRRSQVISSLERLGTKTAQTQQAIWHPEDGDSLPRVFRDELQRYYECSDAQSIAIIPLIQKQDPSTDPDDLKAIIKDRDASRGQVVGILFIEGLQNALSRRDIQPQWRLVEKPVVNSLANARQHNSLFLMPVWKELGHFANLFRGHHRNKAIAFVATAFAILLALALVPSDLKLRSEGVVQPVKRSNIYAEMPGVVQRLLVSEGQFVEKGQTLIELSNPELLAEIARVEGDLRETKERLRTAKLLRIRDDFESESQRKMNVLESAGYAASLDKLQEQLALLKEKKQQLTVRSPFAGQIMTWDTQRRLSDRPVEPGQKLMTIADAEGPWELELKLADRRSGYLRDYWNTHALQDLRAGEAPNYASALQSETPPSLQPPRATYVLASHPTVINEGHVRRIAKSADVDDEEGNIIRVYVDIDEHPSKGAFTIRPGTEVIAHIHAGRASIGYCKLFEFFDWMRRLWFKFV